MGQPGRPQPHGAGYTARFNADVLHAPRDTRLHLAAALRAYQEVADHYRHDPPQRAVEYFGGQGGQSLIIQTLMRPARHTIIDSDPRAVAHLSTTVGKHPGVDVVTTDAYTAHHCTGLAAVLDTADLVALDAPDITITTAATSPHRDLLNRTFTPRPRAVVLTDTAGQRDYRAYLADLTGYLRSRYGYRLALAAYHHAAAVLALVPGEQPAAGRIVPVRRIVPIPRAYTGTQRE